MNKHKLHSTLRILLLCVCICVFCYSSYRLIDIFLEYKKGTDIYGHIEDVVLDTSVPQSISFTSESQEQPSETIIPFTYDHAALTRINPDGIGYLYMPAFDMRLPLVQTDNNDYYLSHTFDLTENSNGCIFEDYRIQQGIDSPHVILYGHNMRNDSMFAKLLKYDSADFWGQDDNRYFYIYTGDSIRKYCIFSTYITDPVSDTYTFGFDTENALQNYALQRKKEALFDTGISIEHTTQVVTLSTCTNDTTRRFIVHGTYVGSSSDSDVLTNNQ